MAMTMTQKILASHAGLPQVRAGQLIRAKMDLVLGNDITTPVAVNEFKKHSLNRVFDRDKIAIVLDHFTPNKDIKAAEQSKQCRAFAKDHDITHFYDVGKMGIEHALLPEQGLVAAGEAVIGADSHTCTYGALGAFSTGVGSTDMAAGMATGECWFRVPSAIRVVLTGKPGKWVGGKDVVLTLIGKIGVEGARYQSLEFTGEGVSALSMDDRFTIANMAIEAGAKNGIFPVDAAAVDYMKGRVNREYRVFEADPDAEYTETVELDLSAIRPTVACPHLPSNTKAAADAGGVRIDQAVIGSCTNGRLSDMRIAAELLKGRKIADGVRAIVIPATQAVWREAMRLGYLDTFVEAGCAVSTPTCGPCLGGYMGILAAGERAVATTNRNFVGRMGHPSSEVYLAGPAVAAASAVLGRIASPEELEKGEF